MINLEELRNAFLLPDEISGAVIVSREDFTDADFAAVISNLPPLPQVRQLLLSGMQIYNEGVKALADATKARIFPRLRVLQLTRTQLGNESMKELADAAKANGFPQLRTLGLARTQVGNEGVKSLADAAKAKGFPQLRTLLFEGTQVGDEGVEELARAAEAEEQSFPRLQKLSLLHTQVGNKGVEALARAAEKQRFPHLQRLVLWGTRVMIATEELATGDPQRIFRALKGTAIAEAKVVVLGEPEAGKSWFCKRFFLNEIPSGRQETHDIELISPNWKPRVGNMDVDLKVWDFGGHHVLHGTHEMFLTRRSLAILVLDVTRSLQSNRAEYWRKLLRHCAGEDTPTIVVVSKCDEEFPITMHRIGQVDSVELQCGLAQVPQVIQNFSALERLPKPGQPEPVAIEALRTAIVTAVRGIEDVHKKVSPESTRMKRRVEREMKGRALVSLSEYHDWCREEDVDDRNQSILRTLHNFGSAFFFGHTAREKRLALDDAWLCELPPGEQRFLTAKRDSILDKWIVNPHWLKWPIYEVIRQSADSQRMPNGLMTIEEIVEFARQGALDKGLEMPLPDGPTYVCKVLALIGLCWELNQGVFLFPRGLSDDKPYACDTWEESGWWEWEFLPEDSFHRFVVRMHERREVVKDGEGAWQHWRGAVVIEHPPGCRAAILANPASGRLEARLDPKSQQPEGFAKLCEFVGDLFENEIVNRPAKKKQLPSAIAYEDHLIENSDEMTTEERVPEPVTHSPLEFARLIDIHNAIKSVMVEPGTTSPCLPDYASMSKWKVRDNDKTHLERRFHIGDTLDCFAKYYYKKKGATLTSEDRERIEMKILKIAKTNLG